MSELENDLGNIKMTHFFSILALILLLSELACAEVVNVFNNDGSIRAAIVKKEGAESTFLVRIDGSVEKKLNGLVLEYERQNASAGAYFLRRGGVNRLRKNADVFGESNYELYVGTDTVKLFRWNPKNVQKPIQSVLSEAEVLAGKGSK
jgi:hypothetical protein